MIPLFKVFMSKDLNPIMETLKSGYIAQGPKSDEFERILQNHFGNTNIVTVNSCTSAIHLALHLIKEREGLDESCKVVCSPLTCAAGIFPILLNGLSVQWCDVSKADLNIDLNKLENELSENTRIVSFVHWGGYPIDYDRLSKIKIGYENKYKKRLYIIEDCAHAWGSTYKGKPVGSFFDFSCFSFQAIKSLTTGDGGLLITPEDFKREARLARWFGLDRDNKVDFRNCQDIERAGFKFHMNDIASSIGICNYPHIERLIKKNQSNSKKYYELLSSIKEIQLLENRQEAHSSCWLFTILANNRSSLSKHLLDQGIQSSPVHSRNDVHTPLKPYKKELPTLDALEDQILCIPCGWWVTDEQIEHISRTIKEFYSGLKI